MEKIIHKLINEFIEGIDTYTHNGSTWLIFTEQKSWVIELTESKTLWYNYNFFKELFSLTSMDVVDNQHYITKWVEDNIINKVKDIRLEINITEGEVDDIIQDGVKETKSDDFNVSQFLCEEVIDKGVKETKISPTHTEYGDWLDGDERLDEIIQNGVKETYDDAYHHKGRIDGVIKNGVKETHREICEYKQTVGYIIQTGVKETKTPGNGDLFSTFQWMEENNTKSVPKMIDDVIENGVKETLNTEYMPQIMVEDTIQNGTKNPTD